MKLAVRQRPDSGTGGEDKEPALKKSLELVRSTNPKAKAG